MKQSVRLGVVGAGNMSRALLEGLSQTTHPFAIRIFDLEGEKAAQLARDMNRVSIGNAHVEWAKSPEDVRGARFFLLACKPQHLADAASMFKAMLSPDSLLISILAGTSTASLQSSFSTERVVRLMPNTPCLIGQGVTLTYFSPSLSPLEREQVASLIRPVSLVVDMNDESLIDRSTGVTGSGPALVFEWASHWISFLVENGVDATLARDMTLRTIRGSIELAEQQSLSLEELRDQVTSKGGVTARALQVLRERDWAQTTRAAFEGAYARAQELLKS